MHYQLKKRSAVSAKKLYWEKKKPYRQEQKKKILESFPSIGKQLSEELLNRFKTLDKIFDASIEELTSIPGIGKKKAKQIKWMLKEQKLPYTID